MTDAETKRLVRVAMAIKEAWPDDMKPITLQIARVLAEAALKAAD